MCCSLDIIRSMTAERPKSTPAAIGRVPKAGRRAGPSPVAAAASQSVLSGTTPDKTAGTKTGSSGLRQGVSFAAGSTKQQSVLTAIAPEQQQQKQRQQVASSKKGWLLSEATLSHAVIQHLDFNLQHQTQQHLFLEVRCSSHCESSCWNCFAGCNCWSTLTI